MVVLRLGIRGAALGTIISQAISAATVLWYFFRHKKSIFVLRFKFSMINLHIFKRIFATGFSAFVFQLVTSGIFVFLNNYIRLLGRSDPAWGGDNAINTLGIIYAVLSVVLMPLFGINQSLNPIVGYNYGAKRYDRVKKTLFWAIVLATAITCTCFILTVFLTEPVVLLFVKYDSAMFPLAVHAFKVFLILLPLLGAQIVAANFFQAIGKARQALLLNMSRQVFVFLPAVLILPFTGWGMEGLLWAGPLSDAVAFALTAILVALEMKKIGGLELEMKRI
jgi:Na+-driven multidrug efflux pump